MNYEKETSEQYKQCRHQELIKALHTRQDRVVLRDDGCTTIYGVIKDHMVQSGENIAVVNMNFTTDVRRYKDLSGVQTKNERFDISSWEDLQTPLVLRNFDSYLNAHPEFTEEDDYLMYLLHMSHLWGSGTILTVGSDQLTKPGSTNGSTYWLDALLSGFSETAVIS